MPNESEKTTSASTSSVKNNKALKIGIGVAILAILAVIVAVVVNTKPYNTEDEYIAAQMGDFVIYESDITNYIKAFKSEYGINTEEEWNAFLDEGGNTNVSVRRTVIDTMIERHIGEEFIKENGIEISEDEIESEYRDRYASYYVYDGGYKRGLKNSFLTEAMNHDSIKNDLAYRKYMGQTAIDEVTDEDVLNAINENIDAYNTLAYRDYMIIDDKFVMDAVVKKLEAGEDFEALKEQYCYIDTPDTGWSGAMMTYDKDREPFYNQLVALKTGEWTDPYREDEDNYIIGYCKIRFEDIDTSSYANIPEDIANFTRDQLIEERKDKKITEYKNDIVYNRDYDVVINEAPDPDNLKY